jgi:hypothetical protein
MTFILRRAAAVGFAVVHNIEELRQPIEVIRVFRLLGSSVPPRFLLLPGPGTITEVSGYLLLAVRLEQEEENSAQVRL